MIARANCDFQGGAGWRERMSDAVTTDDERVLRVCEEVEERSGCDDN